MKYCAIFLSKLKEERLQELADFITKSAGMIVDDFYFVTTVDGEYIVILGFIIETTLRLDEVKNLLEEYASKRNIKVLIFSPYEFVAEPFEKSVGRLASSEFF